MWCALREKSRTCIETHFEAIWGTKAANGGRNCRLRLPAHPQIKSSYVSPSLVLKNARNRILPKTGFYNGRKDVLSFLIGSQWRRREIYERVLYSVPQNCVQI